MSEAKPTGYRLFDCDLYVMELPEMLQKVDGAEVQTVGDGKTGLEYAVIDNVVYLIAETAE